MQFGFANRLTAQMLPPLLSVNKFSVVLARRIWWACLWLMRRPFMKAAQRLYTFALPPSMRAAGMRSMHRQNAFARRVGLSWLTNVITFCLFTVVVTWTYQAAIVFVQSGVVKPTARMASMFIDNGE